MSFIRDEDESDFVAAAVIAFIVGLILCGTVFAERPQLTIRDRVTATEDEVAECVFHLDTVTITAPEQYTCDWLAGSNGYRMTLTIAPTD